MQRRDGEMRERERKIEELIERKGEREGGKSVCESRRDKS